MKPKTIIIFLIALFLCASLASPLPAFAQGSILNQDEVQIILIQFKLYETFVQGDLPQYMTLWSPDAEFRSGGVKKGKQEIEAYASGLMQGKPQVSQNRLVLTIKGQSATLSTRTLYEGGEFDIVYRYVKRTVSG